MKLRRASFRTKRCILVNPQIRSIQNITNNVILEAVSFHKIRLIHSMHKSALFISDSWDRTIRFASTFFFDQPVHTRCSHPKSNLLERFVMLIRCPSQYQLNSSDSRVTSGQKYRKLELIPQFTRTRSHHHPGMKEPKPTHTLHFNSLQHRIIPACPSTQYTNAPIQHPQVHAWSPIDRSIDSRGRP